MNKLMMTPKNMGVAERRVVDAFVAALKLDGWTDATEVNHPPTMKGDRDLSAARHHHTARGRT